MAYEHPAQRQRLLPGNGAAPDRRRAEAVAVHENVDRDPHDLADLYADNPHLPYLNGSWPGVAVAPYSQIFATAGNLGGREGVAVSGADVDLARADDVGPRAPLRRGDLGVGRGLVALAAALTACRRRLVPDWVAVGIYTGVGLFVYMLWPPG